MKYISNLLKSISLLIVSVCVLMQSSDVYAQIVRNYDITNAMAGQYNQEWDKLSQKLADCDADPNCSEEEANALVEQLNNAADQTVALKQYAEKQKKEYEQKKNSGPKVTVNESSATPAASSTPATSSTPAANNSNSSASSSSYQLAQIDMSQVIEEEAPEEEAVGGWQTLDKETQNTIAKNQARYNATGGNEAAQEIYDAQQNRINQQQNTQAVRDNNVAEIQKKLAEQKAQNNERVANMQAQTNIARQDYTAAQEKLKNATTPEEMKAANEALKAAKENLEKAEDAQKDVEKDVKKANKELDKTAEKQIDAMDDAVKEQQKALEKEQKEQKKAIEKEQKQAEKDLKKANKEIEKLEEKCAKGKCDDDDLADLAAARASASSAQSALDNANQKAAAFNAEDEDVAAQEYMDERDAEIAAEAAQENALAEAASADQELADAKKDIASAQSAAPKMCSEAEGNIFLLIACKAMITLADLRVIAYIISGFGMIALAYAAIFGKMSFKHLANIGIGLFLLSMMTPFIEYFTTGKDGTLRFGKYLPAGFTDIQGSDGQVYNCGAGGSGEGAAKAADGSYLCPEVTVTGIDQSYKKEKWSLKDLKGSIQAGISAVRNASDMYKAAKTTVTNVANTVSNMKAQIKAGGGGLDGIINAAGAVANATGSIVSSGQTLANNIATNAGELSSNIKDAGSTNAAREAVAKVQEKTDALQKKCDAGNCSDVEKEQLEVNKEFLESEKTGVNKWLENDGAGGGATILSGINKVGNITSNAAKSVNTAATAAKEGQSIGGDGALGAILGVGFGVGTAVTEGVNTVSQGQKNGAFDFRSEETKREEKAQAEQEAFQKTAGYVKSETKSGDTTIQNLGDGSIKTINESTGTTTVISTDGTTTITGKDGSTIVKNKDGSKVVTDADGNKITYDSKGNKVSTELVNKYNRPTAESMTNALKGTKTEEKPTEEKPAEEKDEKESKKQAEEKTQTISEEQKNTLKQQCSRYTGDYIALKSKCEACVGKSTIAEINSCIQAIDTEAKEINQCNDAKFKQTCFDTGEPKEACAKCNYEKRAQEKATAEAAAEITDQQRNARCQTQCQGAKRKEQCLSDCKALLANAKTKAEVNQKMTEFPKGKDFYNKYNK